MRTNKTLPRMQEVLNKKEKKKTKGKKKSKPKASKTKK
jgi:hypothetical protein